jgi:hypothetical protein
LRIGTKRKLHALEFASAMPAVGEFVATFCPDGELQGKVIETHAAASVAGRKVLATTLNAVPGWSGGPVVNLEGKVVGINSELSGTVFVARDIRIGTSSGAVPLDVLQELLKLARLSEAIRLNPDKVEAYQDRAEVYFSKNDMPKAIADYTKVIQVKPTVEAYCRRARAYVEGRQLEKAVDDYSKAINLDPACAEPYRERAKLREKKGDLGGAIRLHKKHPTLSRIRGGTA